MPVSLRPPTDSDLELWFQFQTDPQANEMAAFTSEDPNDREAYIQGWRRKLGLETVRMRTILCQEQVVGSVGSFEMMGNRELTYWLGRPFWGRGLATLALEAFLIEEPVRPLHARVAKHNLGSQRVLEKCGFQVVDEETGYSKYLKRDVEELVYRLDPHGDQ